MTEIALVLSNSRPQPADGAYEHLFPEKSPRWLFAQVQENPASLDAAMSDVVGDTSALAMKATRHGPRAGHAASGPAALWVVLTNPAAGREAEYDEWYDERHLADTLAIPGIVSAQRYKVTATIGSETTRWAYLALYEMERDRVAEVLAEAAARAGTDKMPNFGLLAPGTAALAFGPIG